jgi:hypothetical protein
MRRTLSILTMLSIALATWALMGRGLVVDKLGLYDLTAVLTAMVSALLAFDKTLRNPMCLGIITGWLVACVIRPVRPLESLVIAFAAILCLTLWDLDHIMRDEGEVGNKKEKDE